MLLTDLFSKTHPMITAGQLHLAIWKLSDIENSQKVFQQKLLSCWQQDRADA